MKPRYQHMQRNGKIGNSLIDRINGIGIPFLLVCSFIMLIFALCISGAYITNRNEETITITIIGTEVKQRPGEKDQTYLIYAQREDGVQEVFMIKDSVLQWKFNSADVYFLLKSNVGKKARITVVGTRNDFFSWNRNIISAEILK